MPRDDDKSLGDEATLQGGKPTPADERSLGDRSTFGGSEGSSLSDLGEFADLPDHDMEIVDLSSRYKIENSLGKGGMGEVLLATDTRLDRKVAIKRIRGDAGSSKAAVARFLTEAKSIAALSHNNVVQVYDYGRDQEGPFLIMEYVAGGTLLDRCKQGPIELEEAVELACQLCDGLGRAHDAGIIHRDIKPANILLTDDGVPKLTDFGLAKAESRDHTMTMAGAVLGTLDFMPPEQRQDASLVDARSDLWSLAATLYQMVTGESPKVIRLKKVPTQLQELIDKALEEAKEDRYQTVNELRDAFHASLKTSLPVDQVPVDLGAGECPKCHVRNDARRKFCSGCGGSLRVTCLSCSAEIPIWERFCGECGGNQADLLEEKIAEYQKQKQQAEEHRGEYLFSDAIRISTELSELEDERFVAFRDWGNSFADEVESEQERLSNEAHQHFEEAKKHRAAFDYPASIQAMKSIPEPICSVEMHGYHAQLVSDRDESERLLVEIKEAITKRTLDGLLPKVERELELRGDRQDLLKLKSQLLAREQKLMRQRDDAYSSAANLFELGDAKGAFSKINTVKTKNLRESDRQLEAKLTEVLKAEQSLKQLVADCKADGVIGPSEVAKLLAVVLDYLEMNPNHAAIQRLQEDLISRKASYLPSHVTLANFPAAVLKRLQPITNSIGMELKLIPSGTFTMGENDDAHEVTLTKPFMLGIHEVTQTQHERVMGINPSKFRGADNPVDRVSWEDAVEFCRKLSELPAERAAGRVYRLPTEAEWEYACRAGKTTDYSFGTDDSELVDYAWFGGNSGDRTHPVGGKKPNAWGLYDMHGNVWEWCQDRYGYYPSGTVTDPTGATDGSLRVGRGGSWINPPEFCRSAYHRRGREPSFRNSLDGLRVALSLSSQ